MVGEKSLSALVAMHVRGGNDSTSTPSLHHGRLRGRTAMGLATGFAIEQSGL